MKVTITAGLIQNAIDLAERSRDAHTKGNPDDEVRWSVGAHLMVALALEGLANEVGEAVFDTWTWERLEKSDTPLKLRILSGSGGRTALDPSKQPLQFIQQLFRARNDIVHPKPQQPGDEIIVRSKSGQVKRNIPLDARVEDGDIVFIGLGKLLDRYSYANAATATQKTISAMKALRDHLEMTGLDWINDKEGKLEQLIAGWSA